MMGLGVRGNPKLTVFLDGLVNAIAKNVPDAKLGFDSSPGSTLDAVRTVAPFCVAEVSVVS